MPIAAGKEFGMEIVFILPLLAAAIRLTRANVSSTRNAFGESALNFWMRLIMNNFVFY